MVNLYLNNKLILNLSYKNHPFSVKSPLPILINKLSKKYLISNLISYQPEEKISSLKSIEEINNKNYHYVKSKWNEIKFIKWIISGISKDNLLSKKENNHLHVQ